MPEQQTEGAVDNREAAMHYHVTAGNPHLLDEPIIAAGPGRDALDAAGRAVDAWLDACRARHASAHAELAELRRTLAVHRTPTQDDRVLALLGAPVAQVGLAAGVELYLDVPCQVRISACYDRSCTAAGSGIEDG
jgi:hypothetical protein